MIAKSGKIHRSDIKIAGGILPHHHQNIFFDIKSYLGFWEFVNLYIQEQPVTAVTIN